MDKNPPADSYHTSKIKRLLEFLGINRTPDTTADLEQEIQDLLEEGEEHGLISSQEGRMINSIFEFRDTLAREIMTPGSEMVCAEVSTSIPDLIQLITAKGFTRIPIYAKTPDHIIGILRAKDLLKYCVETAGQPPGLSKLVYPAYFVMEDKRIVDLLRDFQAKKVHMAIVTDEFGSVRGLVTLEDVLEEIVGEIDDEYDKVEKRWRVLDDQALLIHAKVDIEEVEAFFQVVFPAGPYESVGGLVIHQLGRVPAAGESVVLQGLNFQVVSATKRQIKTVKIQKNASVSIR